jgi:outer membrane protein OmpU
MTGAWRCLLLGSTASLALATAVSPPTRAAEVLPGGALDITLSGFVRFLSTYGAWDDTQLDPGLSTGLDFENDTEVHVLVRGKHDATGVEYGGRIELEADTNASNNTDETWVFLRGGFGEFRLGDEDGIADEDGMAVSAASVAAGTGGLDGTQVDTYVTRAFEPFGTSDATKAIYRSPSFGGFRFGASYTPNLSTIDNGSGNGDSLASKDVQAGDIVEGGVGYEGDIGGMATEIALTGLYGDVKDEATFGDDDYWAGQIGASLDFGAFSLAGSFLKEKIGEAEQDAYTLGAAYEIGLLSMSINYAESFNTEQRPTADFEFDNPRNIVVSATFALMPGLTLDGDVAFIDNDITGGPAEVDDDEGVVGVLQLGLAF